MQIDFFSVGAPLIMTIRRVPIVVAAAQLEYARVT